MIRSSKLFRTLAGLLGVVAACVSAPAAEAVSTVSVPGPRLSSVLFLGDSNGVTEALPLASAFAASNVRFASIAENGGGNFVGPFAQRESIAQRILSARASVVIYSITLYDWGTPEEQAAAYQTLLDTTVTAGSRLVILTPPPIGPDDFFDPHMGEVRQAVDVARTIAAKSAGRATLLDTRAVWGDTFQHLRDGKADRSSDGVHICQPGAARFTVWLLRSLQRIFPGFTPARPQAWLTSGWAADDSFTKIPGCTGL